MISQISRPASPITSQRVKMRTFKIFGFYSREGRLRYMSKPKSLPPDNQPTKRLPFTCQPSTCLPPTCLPPTSSADAVYEGGVWFLWMKTTNTRGSRVHSGPSIFKRPSSDLVFCNKSPARVLFSTPQGRPPRTRR